MDDSNQKPITNEPYIQPTSSPLNPTAQQVGPLPQSINPEVTTTQPQPTVSVASPSVVTGSPAPNPTKSKKNLFIIIGVIVIILIALALYFFVFHKSSKTTTTNTSTTKSATSTTNQSQTSNNSTCTTTSSDSTFTCQKVVTVVDVLTPNSPSLTYYILFYKDATLKTYNGATSQLLSNSGQAQIAITGTNNVDDANPNPTKGCSGEPTFPFTYKGTAETGCYDLATSQTPNNNQYYGTITVGGEYYGVSMVAANPVSLSTVETIFDSINIM